MSLPTITGTARLTDDPELRFGTSGTAICKVRLAFNERRKNQQTQEWEDGDTFFVDGTVFKQEAENVAESLQRGMEVLVTGRLKTRQYEKDGQKRYATELLVSSIGPTLRNATAVVTKAGKGGSASRLAPAASNGFDEEPPW